MARKLEFKIHNWILFIVKSYLAYETLNTLEILKSTGGIRRDIGDPQEQYEEIKSVLDLLAKELYLKPIQSAKGFYWGINFENVTYEATQKFIDYVEQIQITNTSQLSSGKVQKIIVNQKIYSFNLNLAINKLLGIDFKLFG